MLPPILRVLLVTDGTVTRILEAYFGEPVGVDVLSHSELRSDRRYPEIDVLTGDPILRRCVTLRGRVTHTIYVYAKSTVVLACVPQDVRRKLIEGKKGVGELLLRGRVETYRELLAIRRAPADEWGPPLGLPRDASVLVRSYKIWSEGRAAIAIEEVFPESRFGEDKVSAHARGVR